MKTHTEDIFIQELKEMKEIQELVKDDDFAHKLYSSLCNIEWEKNGEKSLLSWRTAGGVVAEKLRTCGEDYLDFYLGSNEYNNPGALCLEVKEILNKYGWTENVLEER